MRVSRAMTVVWGVVLAAVAFGARRLEDNVVNNALAIASFVSGILLGLFLLGILTRRVGQIRGAGRGARRARAVFAKFGTPLAWPWFALVGSSTVFAVGLAASFVVRPLPGSPWPGRSYRRGPGRGASLPPTHRGSGPAKASSAQASILVDLDDLREADGPPPRLCRMSSCILQNLTGRCRSLADFTILNSAEYPMLLEVSGPTEVEQERPVAILADGRGQLADELLGPVGALDIHCSGSRRARRRPTVPQAEMLESRQRPSPGPFSVRHRSGPAGGGFRDLSPHRRGSGPGQGAGRRPHRSLPGTTPPVTGG